MTSIPSQSELSALALETARRCGVDLAASAGDVPTSSPVNGQGVTTIGWRDAAYVDEAVGRAQEAFREWRRVPAPARGALVKRWAELLAEHKDDLATLVSIEAGKITSEARGEIQEMIDICDFAVGLSRQLYGRTMPSERPGHRLMETWHPLGVVGVISAFNFPAAVWSWNTAVALVCGDPVVWKPSELTPLTALACQATLAQAIAEHGAPEHLSQVVLGGPEVGEALVDHPGVALLSATGSTRMGRAVGPRVADRFGRSLLELGGNNAAVVTGSADLDLAVRGIVFAAAGTAGQRCTTMRRVIAHTSVADELTDRLAAAYERLPIGNPMQEGTLVGPLVNKRAYDAMAAAITDATGDGGKVVAGGGRAHEDLAPDAYYARPAIVRMPEQTAVVARETFAPLLYVVTYDEFEHAIEINNAVPQGLSSSVFTQDLVEAELFVSAEGSDCGIVNVNIGTSGAEIGGAFGGEKETGGGRESGSDAWRAYMRRATNTINFSGNLPLAQGVDFTI
ncbi:aldehyde dehydrogenase family protein [Nocardioides sp. MAH-18]|uniref:aldehyde dehydrogenase (NAD(+)) n=1 Tax=Nocardioides agri TaxID=2682843 RepID=A0A6L6XSG6_9ACTN|nr:MULTISPECIES: aldehyde dehydrogenase family protein [unclassified Nocardioides]MBA2953701.1 aldehyde dehydrogenase family protein [Nocardioides sp. CGMCC 1.13656]MVQ48565.1 aldehyde dehydrogenase family protein [Nocardioides sp. MAH-18]